jgi:hypothetical protein
MYKIILVIISLFLISCTTTGKTIITDYSSSVNLPKNLSNKNLIYLVYDNKIVQTLTIEQFNILINSAGIYSNELDAEKNNRIKIELTKSPWTISIGDKFISNAIITWCDKKGKVIKKVIVEISIERNKDSIWMKIESYYTVFSKVWTPISIIVIVVMAIVL